MIDMKHKRIAVYILYSVIVVLLSALFYWFYGVWKFTESLGQGNRFTDLIIFAPALAVFLLLLFLGVKPHKSCQNEAMCKDMSSQKKKQKCFRYGILYVLSLAVLTFAFWAMILMWVAYMARLHIW